MSTPAPLYYVGPAGPAQEVCASLGEGVRFFENLGDFESAQDKAPGLVVITSAH
jgi:hypothetical protein